MRFPAASRSWVPHLWVLRPIGRTFCEALRLQTAVPPRVARGFLWSSARGMSGAGLEPSGLPPLPSCGARCRLSVPLAAAGRGPPSRQGALRDRREAAALVSRGLAVRSAARLRRAVRRRSFRPSPFFARRHVRARVGPPGQRAGGGRGPSAALGGGGRRHRLRAPQGPGAHRLQQHRRGAGRGRAGPGAGWAARGGPPWRGAGEGRGQAGRVGPGAPLGGRGGAVVRRGLSPPALSACFQTAARPPKRPGRASRRRGPGSAQRDAARAAIRPELAFLGRASAEAAERALFAAELGRPALPGRRLAEERPRLSQGRRCRLGSGDVLSRRPFGWLHAA